VLAGVAETHDERPNPGLAFRRFFTQPGVDPFDAVEWEMRDAVIGSEKGEKVFEQKGVEIPKAGRRRRPTSWSRSTSAATSARRERALACAS
jgi:hypothetical protein